MTVIANLSAEPQQIALQPQGEVLMNNYAELRQTATGLELLPYQALYWLVK